MKKYSAWIIGLGSIGIGTWWYRPIADDMVGNSGPKRGQFWSSTKTISDFPEDKLPWLFKIGQWITIPFSVSAFRTMMIFGGKFRLKKDSNYENFLSYIQQRSARKPLISVSNHRCLTDDPPFFSAIIPYTLVIQPTYTRYAVCSQEYCFQEKVPSFIHAYFGSGNVFPIWRGGGINQKLFLDFGRILSSGGWCHVFPEAGIWQEKGLGGRRNGQEKRHGKLKWGVGKLIAHSQNPPVVIPFAHRGTEDMIPQHPQTKAIQSALPSLGQYVSVVFGPEMDFRDLVEEHERVHGPLWKMPGRGQSFVPPESSDPRWKYSPQEYQEDFHLFFDSSPAELELYSAITLRVEAELERLNEQCRLQREEDMARDREAQRILREERRGYGPFEKRVAKVVRSVLDLSK